eukprot:UN20027
MGPYNCSCPMIWIITNGAEPNSLQVDLYLNLSFLWLFDHCEQEGLYFYG